MQISIQPKYFNQQPSLHFSKFQQVWITLIQNYFFYIEINFDHYATFFILLQNCHFCQETKYFQKINLLKQATLLHYLVSAVTLHYFVLLQILALQQNMEVSHKKYIFVRLLYMMFVCFCGLCWFIFYQSNISSF